MTPGRNFACRDALPGFLLIPGMRRTFNQFRVFLETNPYTAAATVRLSRRARAAIFVYRLSIRILAQWARDKCPQQAAALAFQTALSLVPESTHGVQAVIGVLIIIAIAFAYQQSRFGRLLRASREDAAAAEGVGVNVHRQRLWAFTLSGALAGFSGPPPPSRRRPNTQTPRPIVRFLIIALLQNKRLSRGISNRAVPGPFEAKVKQHDRPVQRCA